MSINISWPSNEGLKEVVVPLPLAGIRPLRDAVKHHLGTGFPSQSFMLTDTLRDITNDEDVAQLKDGTTLVVTHGKDGALAAPARERISFQPHPKTLTMAGDYEYFAAQGRHPFVYALAEFIDNSLRATRKNAPNPRNISITLLTTGSGASKKGLVVVQDNGVGMTKHELNDWAVMNYSMEERGAAPQEPAVLDSRGRITAPAPGRFLTGDLSFFGVGSKNAAFFMGSSVKVTTRKAGERYVHELCLAAADLEARYRNNEAVYEEDMVHRNPGDESTLSRMEVPFTAARGWLREEVQPESCGASGAFTRVVIGDLKPDILQQLAEDVGGAQICRELAHLYHYYLHGEAGNKIPQPPVSPNAPPCTLPNGEPLPCIALRHASDARVLWQRSLVDVDDDLETRILRAHKSEFQFSLSVPDRGTVSGVLYYFPYENDRETVPLEAGPSWSAATGHGAAPSQAPGGGRTQAGAAALTQLGAATAARTQQHHHLTAATAAAGGGHGNGSNGGSQDDASDEEDTGAVGWRDPSFQAFWQGRLIPGASVDTLAFMEAVRQKRSAAAKDSLPDEVFKRLKGALFFGPGFRVTRNKLLFRDNLPEVLSTAVPGDRNLEKRFKDWLTRCHATLDKSFRFERLADSRTQAALRSRRGEGITAFERISDGQRSISTGDVVRISAKPTFVGRVAYFSVPQAVREEGAFANGRVHVDPLPKEIHGDATAAREFSLRRLEAVLDEKETEEHCLKEMARLPASLRVEPMRFATGDAVELMCGDCVPETSIAVLSGGGGQKLVRSFYNGEKQSLLVTQCLWKLPHEGAPLPADAVDGGVAVEEQQEEVERPVKRARKGRKGKKQQQQDEAAAEVEEEVGESGAAKSTSAAELIVSVENKTPYKDSFIFSRISDGLKRAGHYVLEYSLSPAVGGQPQLRCTVPLTVIPGGATTLKVVGEGVLAVASREIVMGETLPPFSIQLCDDFGNPVALPSSDMGSFKVHAKAPVPGADGAATTLEKCKGIAIGGDAQAGGSSVLLCDLKLVGSKKASAAGIGHDLFKPAGDACLTDSACAGGQRSISQTSHISAASAFLCFSMVGSSIAAEAVPLRLRPGAPRSLQLVPGGHWDSATSSASVPSGGELPEFCVRAIDAWGNPTAPSERLKFSVAVECDALAGSPSTFEVDASGVATITGLRAVTRRSGPATVTLRVQCSSGSEAMQTAIDAAQPGEDLSLPLLVIPSSVPALPQIMVSGEPVQMEDRPDEDGNMVPTAIIKGVEAGSSVGGLRLVLLDESGAPAAESASGKITVSWHSGSKKINWKGDPIKLPPLKASDSVNEATNGFLRFIGGDANNPINIECFVEILPVAGPPSAWAVSLVDQVNSQSSEQQGFILCGQPFALEIEALDRLNNRCGGGAATLPEPIVTLESDGPLEYSPEDWERAWVAQGSEEVFTIRMAVSGHPGEVKFRVRDTSQGEEDKRSLLGEDSLTVELRPGPPSALAFNGAASVECGTRAVLGHVEIVLRDAGGYPTKSTETFEVTLAGSALACDGSGRAAKVVVSGGNKAKMTKGKGSAVFKGVTVTADAPGTYTLRVQSSSRKVALQEGALQLVMAPITAVTGLHVMFPPELANECTAGMANQLLVAVETENGQVLPEEVAVAGLSLRVTPPGGTRSDAILCALPTLEEGESLPMQGGAYSFALSDLTVAGTWTAAAEFAEPRAEVRAALGKGAQVRSAAVQFTVISGPPVTAAVEAPQLPDRVAVTNAVAVKSRLLVRNAAVQVQDAFGNAADAEGVQVRFRLIRAAMSDAAASPGGGDGAVLPTLSVEEGEAAKQLDDRGRAYFGKLMIVEGSGAAPAGALDCVLVCEALGLYPSAEHELEMDAEGWAVCWKCPVLFSDNKAQFAALEGLNEQRGVLLERRAVLESQVEGAQKAMAAAEKQRKRAAEAAAVVEKRVAGELPSSVKAAEKQLKKLEKAAQGDAEPEKARRPAGWGSSKFPITGAIDLVLRSGDQGLVGVLAQLITIDDERLATVASYALRSTLGVIVVEDAPSRARIASSLTAKKYPMPDVLPLTQINSYRGSKSGDIPGFAKAGELAQTLTRAACAGTDGPLPLPLPHQRGGAANTSAPDWPPGCLGYLCNLVRPVHDGHRGSVVYGLLSGTILFETLQNACAYREHVTQSLKIPFSSEMLSLDGGRVTGRGVISGSNFRPVPLDKADFVIGSGEGAPGSGAADKLEALQSWVEVLREREAADGAAAVAAAEVEAVEGKCRSELDGIESELGEVDAQIAQLQRSPGGSNGGGNEGQKNGKQRRGRQNDDDGGGGCEGAEQLVDEGEDGDAPMEGKGRGKRRKTAAK